MSKTTEQFNEFLYGYAKAAGLDRAGADESWAGFSRQLSQSERELIESGGWDAGFENGQAMRKLYPVQEVTDGQEDDSNDPTSCLNPEPARMSRQLDRMMRGAR